MRVARRSHDSSTRALNLHLARHVSALYIKERPEVSWFRHGLVGNETC